jgi:hypothetical protein
MKMLEDQKKMFQVKIDRANWRDVALPGDGLRDIAKEVRGLPRNAKQIKALWQIRSMVVNHHGAIPGHDGVFDVIEEDYEIDSLEDDVLKIKHSFTVRFASADDATQPHKVLRKGRREKAANYNESLEPKRISGVITIMPGN